MSKAASNSLVITANTVLQAADQNLLVVGLTDVGPLEVNLPPRPSPNQTVRVKCAGSNPLTVNGNGNLIDGIANFVIPGGLQVMTVRAITTKSASGETVEWNIVSDGIVP